MLVPSPLQIAEAFLEWQRSGELVADLKASSVTYAIGLVSGCLVGFLLGNATGRSRVLAAILSPWLGFSRSIPLVAMLPVAIVVLGIGSSQKISLVAWGSVFPMWIAVHSGIIDEDADLVLAAKSLGVRGNLLFRKVYFPLSVPSAIAGFRSSIGNAFFALAAAEMAGAFAGVAFRIFFAQESFKIERMFAGIVCIGFLGLTVDWMFVRLVERVFPWWRRS